MSPPSVGMWRFIAITVGLLTLATFGFASGAGPTATTASEYVYDTSTSVASTFNGRSAEEAARRGYYRQLSPTGTSTRVSPVVALPQER